MCSGYRLLVSDVYVLHLGIVFPVSLVYMRESLFGLRERVLCSHP